MKKTVDLSSFNNNEFKVGASKVKRILWYLINALFFKSFVHSYLLKVFFLKLFGAKVGFNVIIKPRVNIKYPWNLSIGNNVWIGENAWIDNLVQVNIGNNVCISQGALLLCGNHHYSKTTFDLLTSSITIEDGVWIGAKSIVCGGVICHTHSILTVLSVANKDLEPYYIYKGNPAEKIKERHIE